MVDRVSSTNLCSSGISLHPARLLSYLLGFVWKPYCHALFSIWEVEKALLQNNFHS